MSDPTKCCQCGKAHPGQAYWEAEPSRYCPDCNMENAVEMTIWMEQETGWSRSRSIESVASSKGPNFAAKLRLVLDALEPQI